MNADLELVLRHVDAGHLELGRQISGIARDLRTMNDRVQDVSDRVTAIETAEETLIRRDGVTVRRGDIWLISSVTGIVLVVLRAAAPIVWDLVKSALKA